jgi:acetolactate synthase-1/2/3 large subunit
MIERADVILAVGNRTNQNGTDSWALLPTGARLIHIDIDPMEIGRNYEAVRLVGDAKATLAALKKALLKRDLGKRKAARASTEAEISVARLKHLDERAARSTSDATPIRPERLMADLDAMLTADHIVVADASYASIWICNNLASRKPGMRFLTPRGMAGLGWGLPMALGAKLARPDAPVFALVGDGGFAHVWSELETAGRHGLHVVVTVLNNQILGYQKHAEDARYGNHTGAVYFEPVDHAAIARACGCRGVTVTTAADYRDVLKEAFAAAGDATTVIDVMVDPDAHPPITAFEKKTRT